MYRSRRAGWRVAASVLALTALGCAGDSSTDVQNGVPASLAGTWELTAVSTTATGPLPASRDRYDAVLTLDSARSTFAMTEWRNGEASASSGAAVVEGDQLTLIHTADYQTVTRVDEALFSVKDGRLALAMGEQEWTVYVYDRP